jgi:hypothetical protein
MKPRVQEQVVSRDYEQRSSQTQLVLPSSDQLPCSSVQLFSALTAALHILRSMPAKTN